MDIPFVYPYNGKSTDDFIGETRLYALFESYNQWLLDMVMPHGFDSSRSCSNDIKEQANKLLRELEYVEFLLQTERDEWDSPIYINYESELNNMGKILVVYYEPSIHFLS